MSALLADVSRLHFPNPPATPAEIDAFEQRVGWRLDPDLRAFYLHCDGAKLFDRVDPAFNFYPLAKIRRARVVLLKNDTDKAGPASWYALCEVRDTNYIFVDVSLQEGERYSIRDGYREAFPDPAYNRRIAGSFSEFLRGALHSNEEWFWLREED
ncbi:SMI1/KNR4 family protein [Corallococcus sp. AB050B]|nr:SMI1/KNR4 family protein [Corallococcus sp. AB050B]